jgi:uncharacterized glyoxalase superfamily protein PhnB
MKQYEFKKEIQKAIVKLTFTLFLIIPMTQNLISKTKEKKMMIQNCYAVIKTSKLEESSQFYEKYFGFKRVFSSDWYISLKTGNIELALLSLDHETIPKDFRGHTSNQSLFLNFETEDVDTIYKKFQADAQKIHLKIKDEPFGQRHFISEDPNGIPIDVIKNIPPSEEFLKNYTK